METTSSATVDSRASETVMRETYPVGELTVTCCLYRRGYDSRGEAMYTLRMEHEGHRCEMSHLTLADGSRLLTVMTASRVSPIHAGDVLEDVWGESLRERFSFT